MKGQALAIGLVVACGVATFVMALTNVQSLELAQETYYERYRFAQVFAHLKRAPKALADRIAEIPGVARVQTRTVVERDAGRRRPARARGGAADLDPRARRVPGSIDLYLRSGRYIEPGRRGEVLVGESFAEAHGLGPGGRVRAVLNGRREVLEIVGVALSPEYVYEIREGELFPDEKRFGVFWMGEPGLADAFDMEGAFNDVALTLTPGALRVRGPATARPPRPPHTAAWAPSLATTRSRTSSSPTRSVDCAASAWPSPSSSSRWPPSC